MKKEAKKEEGNDDMTKQNLRKEKLTRIWMFRQMII